MAYVQGCEIWQTDVITSVLDATAEADHDVAIALLIDDMWAEHIKSLRERRERAPGPSATSYCSSQSCPRQVAFSAQGYEEDDPIRARTRRVFLLGHQIEAAIKAQLLMSGITFIHHCSTILPYPWLGPKEEAIYVGPDGVQLQVNTTPILGYKSSNVILEIKSAATRSFERICKLGIKSGAAGYYDQAQLAMLGFDSDVSVILVQNKDTSHLAEFWVTRDETRIAELTNIMLDVQETPATEMEPHYALQPILKYHGGKPTKGDPVHEERTNVKGNVYGWDELVGWRIKYWECNYCGYKNQCYGNKYNLTLFTEGDTPYWRAEAKE